MMMTNSTRFTTLSGLRFFTGSLAINVVLIVTMGWADVALPTIDGSSCQTFFLGREYPRIWISRVLPTFFGYTSVQNDHCCR